MLRHRPTLALALGAAVALLAALPPAAVSAARCLGKKATIVRGGGDNTIRGTKAPDTIHAGGGRDRVYGRGGNDRICGGAGRDTIVGGRGNDRIDGRGGADRVLGQRGSDRLFGGGGNDRLFGGSGNDRLRGGGGADLVDGGRGDEPLVSGGPGDFDNVVGGTGNDRIDGGPGRHDIASFVTTTAPLRIDLSAGTVRGGEHERLRGFGDALGGSGSDMLIGSSAPNRLDGGPGADSLHAVGPLDGAFGGPGSDACHGPFATRSSCGEPPGAQRSVVVELVRSIDASASLVIEGSGGSDDVVVRRGRRHYLAGVSGAPVTPGTGSACGRAGEQLIVCPGRVGRIQVAMSGGNDAIDLRGVPRGVDATVDGGPGADRIAGGRGRDTIYSGDDRVPDSLAGGPGDDQLFGVNTDHPRKSSGDATMRGGRGDDLLVGGQPCDGDRFLGGPGRNDSASFARIRNDGVNVRAKIGGTVSDPDRPGCDRGRISRSVEKIEGSPGPDRLFGDGSANVLLGRGGNDLLDGRGGHDVCVGGGGRDGLRRCEQRFR